MLGMATLYFCYGEDTPVLRYWSTIPRIGETIALPELGGNLNPLKVFDVVWEGFDEPSISIYLHQARVEHDTAGRIAPGDHGRSG